MQSSVSSSYEPTGEAMEDCPTCLLASLAPSSGPQKLRPCKYRDERHMWLMRFQVWQKIVFNFCCCEFVR